MSKEYKVKCAELMPAFTTNEDIIISVTDEPLDDQYSPEYDSHVEDRPKLSSCQPRPPRRKAAIAARDKWKKQNATVRSCKNIVKKPTVPQHGWNYNDWFHDLEEEPYDVRTITRERPLTLHPENAQDPHSILDDLEQELTRYRESADVTTGYEGNYMESHEDDVFLTSDADNANNSLGRSLVTNQDTRSGSVRYNIYDDGNSRPNSVEYFISRSN